MRERLGSLPMVLSRARRTSVWGAVRTCRRPPTGRFTTAGAAVQRAEGRLRVRLVRDRDAIGGQPLYETDIDLTGPLADWNAHLGLPVVPVTQMRAGRSPWPVRLSTYGAAGCGPACYPQLSGRSEWTLARVSVVRLIT